ncbi:MAG TPA: sialidase family protein [Phycisphaerae bacterium]|nr:sialidase family protein [Phycisphaerae bacterium]HRY66832.1 sialidase family protein [Phycisphaerae bacterium]HSA26890.1 sialidase family protein [Phycisphaerae bacterium]
MLVSKNKPYGLALAILITAAMASLAAADVRLEHTDVFTNGADGYYMYRIPSIARSGDGTIHAIAEGRLTSTADPGGTHIDLVYKRSTDGGRTWSTQLILDRHPDANLTDERTDNDRTSAANAVAVVDRSNNRLWVFDLRMPNGVGTANVQKNVDDLQTWARYSDDNGATWSAAQRITVPQYEDFYPNIGSSIQTRSGRLVVPATAVRATSLFTQSFALFSHDHGLTWQAGGLMNLATNEQQIVELTDTRLFASVRQNSGSYRFHTFSSDTGATWSPLANGLAMTAVASGLERYTQAGVDDPTENRILFSAPAGGSLGARSRLTIKSSFDEGQTFGKPRLLYQGPAAYSDMVRLDGDEVGVFWERGPGTEMWSDPGNQSITYTVFNREFLEPATAQGLWTSESFAYPTGRLKYRIGGNGWNSTWAQTTTLANAATATIVAQSLLHAGLNYQPAGGAASLQGSSMSRGLGTQLNLGADGIYYFSALVRRESTTGSTLQALDFLMLDATGTRLAAFGAGTGGHWFVTELGDTRNTAAGAVASQTTYLLVAKLVADGDTTTGSFDQLFIRVFAADEAIPGTDDAITWTLVGATNKNATAPVDRILIQAGTNALWIVDELRVGNDWASVTGARQPVPPDFDRDGDVDADDLTRFLACVTEPEVLLQNEDCRVTDLDADDDVDQSDFGILQRCYSGTTRSPDPDCAD